LVAGISKSQIGELQRRNIATTADLALMPLPVRWKPDRGSMQSYEKVREQARVQMRGRAEGKVVYEALAVDPGFGLTRLPGPRREIFSLISKPIRSLARAVSNSCLAMPSRIQATS